MGETADISGGQTMHYQTEKCGCIYIVWGGDFAGEPKGKKLSKPCGKHNRRTSKERRKG